MTVEEFISKWGTGNFPSDGARSITGAKMREFKDDIASTFQSRQATVSEFVTSASDVSLDLNNEYEKYLIRDTSFNGDKNMLIINDADTIKFQALLSCTVGNVLTFEETVQMGLGSAGWEDDDKTWTCYNTGDFIIKGIKLNSIWFLTITAY
jgi:hypothetical protein